MQVQQGGPGAPAQGPVRMVMWLAMTASVFVYGAVAFVVARSMEPGPAGLPVWLFPALSVGLATVAVVLHRKLGETQPRRREEPASLVRPLEVQVWVLDETVAILGLVGALLTGNATGYVAYGVASLILLVLHRPQ